VKWIVGVIAALTIGLVGAPLAAGDHCAENDPACHEFDGLDPYFAAFERHGIGYLAGIPLIAEARGFARGRLPGTRSKPSTRTRRVAAC
jgi:hypothetical protein